MTGLLRRSGAVLPALLPLALAGCDLAAPSTAPSPTAIVVTATPRTVAVTLTLTVRGEPTRTFIVAGGRWKVCDTGTVTNPGEITAHDVRVQVTYFDHGVNVGHVGAAEAAAAGALLGDVAPGSVRDFTVCGIASNEPDHDQLQAQVGG